MALAAVGGALGWRDPGAGRVHHHQVPQQPPTGIDGTGSKKEDSAGQTPLLPRSTLLPHPARIYRGQERGAGGPSDD